MKYDDLLSARAKASQPSSLQALFTVMQKQKDLISFAVGAPDLSVLPIDMLEKLTRDAIEHNGPALLQYGSVLGYPPLRQAVLPLFAQRGITATVEDVHISTGGSGALNNVCMALLDKGDTVLVESPTYSPAMKTFAAYGPVIAEVACDEEGMLPDVLEAELKKGGVKFVYLMPTFQNPTGRTMPAARRKVIAELVAKYGSLVIEDDVYYDLRYRGQHVPALQTFAPDNTIYISSLSKIFAPAMRIGMSVIPKPLMEKVLVLKEGIDMQTSSLTQGIATEFLCGDYEAHIAAINKAYGAKLTTLKKALQASMPKGFSWNDPEGGMFLWVKGPDNLVIDGQLLNMAIERGIAFVPGASFFVKQGEGKNTLRISFANPPADKIEEGIKRLGLLFTTIGS